LTSESIVFDLCHTQSNGVPQIRAMQYIGWMLRTNRLLATDPALRSGREFARLFRRDDERPLSPSHVTRWEIGRLPAGHAVLRRYEHMLDLDAESLVAINDALVRSEGSPISFEYQPNVAQHRRQLHELLERARVPGAMNGAGWSQLTERIASQPGLVLHPPRLWREIIENLLNELVVAAYGEWLQRQEAMSRLLEHPDAACHAIAACIAMADDPLSPAVIEPLSLLNVTAEAVANQYVLRQIEQPNHNRALHGALLAAVQKVSQAHFRDSQWTQLRRVVADRGRDQSLDPTLQQLISEVDRRLNQQSPAAVAHRQAGTSRQHGGGDLSPRQTLPSFGDRMAATAQGYLPSDATLDVDDTLPLLVEEAVLDADPDRRLITGMLIAATPYQQPVGRAILDEYRRDLRRRANDMPLSTLRTLTNLGVDLHRPLIHDILTRPGSNLALRRAAAWATPHCRGPYRENTWRDILFSQFAENESSPAAHAELLHGITYGIGTDGHRQLLMEIRDHPGMPAEARSTASWLLASMTVQ
jgi:hypothetical protein